MIPKITCVPSQRNYQYICARFESLNIYLSYLASLPSSDHFIVYYLYFKNIHLLNL